MKSLITMECLRGKVISTMITRPSRALFRLITNSRLLLKTHSIDLTQEERGLRSGEFMLFKKSRGRLDTLTVRLISIRLRLSLNMN